MKHEVNRSLEERSPTGDGFGPAAPGDESGEGYPEESSREPAGRNGQDEYRVELEVFSGPLDLLLHLIRKEEIDIYDIPISRILDQYLAHLEVLRLMELDEVGDFLVMAANLMLIKARMLVPERVDLSGGEDEIEDPRSELVQKLLEYKRYKEAALRLNDQRTARTRLFERGKDREPEAASEPIEPTEAADTLRVELWDLVEAFAKIVREVGAGKDIIPLSEEDRPVQEYMEEIVGRLHRTGAFHLDEIFEGVRNRMHVVSYFMGILELMRSGRVRATQKTPFGRILISPPKARPVVAPPRPEPVPAPPSPAPVPRDAEKGPDDSIRPPAQPDPVTGPGRSMREQR